MTNPDIIACNDCKNPVSCRVSWIGDDKLQYCRVCAPKHRLDMMPGKPTDERIREVYEKAAKLLKCPKTEVYLYLTTDNNYWFNLCQFIRFNS